MTQTLERFPADRVAASLLADVERLTVAWNPNTAAFTRALARQAPTIGAAHFIIGSFGAHPSSVASRLYRAGLPSPKQQLLAFRLSLCLRLARHVQTVKGVAWGLEFSCPQSFGRHIRSHFAMSARTFLQSQTSEHFWSEQVAGLMKWQDERWLSLDVLEGRRPVAVAPQRVAEPIPTRWAGAGIL